MNYNIKLPYYISFLLALSIPNFQKTDAMEESQDNEDFIRMKVKLHDQNKKGRQVYNFFIHPEAKQKAVYDCIIKKLTREDQSFEEDIDIKAIQIYSRIKNTNQETPRTIDQDKFKKSNEKITNIEIKKSIELKGKYKRMETEPLLYKRKELRKGNSSQANSQTAKVDYSKFFMINSENELKPFSSLLTVDDLDNQFLRFYTYTNDCKVYIFASIQSNPFYIMEKISLNIGVKRPTKIDSKKKWIKSIKRELKENKLTFLSGKNEYGIQLDMFFQGDPTIGAILQKDKNYSDIEFLSKQDVLSDLKKNKKEYENKKVAIISQSTKMTKEQFIGLFDKQQNGEIQAKDNGYFIWMTVKLDDQNKKGRQVYNFFINTEARQKAVYNCIIKKLTKEDRLFGKDMYIKAIQIYSRVKNTNEKTPRTIDKDKFKESNEKIKNIEIKESIELKGEYKGMETEPLLYKRKELRKGNSSQENSQTEKVVDYSKFFVINSENKLKPFSSLLRVEDLDNQFLRLYTYTNDFPVYIFTSIKSCPSYIMDKISFHIGVERPKMVGLTEEKKKIIKKKWKRSIEDKLKQNELTFLSGKNRYGIQLDTLFQGDPTIGTILQKDKNYSGIEFLSKQDVLSDLKKNKKNYEKAKVMIISQSTKMTKEQFIGLFDKQQNGEIQVKESKQSNLKAGKNVNNGTIISDQNNQNKDSDEEKRKKSKQSNLKAGKNVDNGTIISDQNNQNKNGSEEQVKNRQTQVKTNSEINQEEDDDDTPRCTGKKIGITTVVGTLMVATMGALIYQLKSRRNNIFNKKKNRGR